MPAAYTARPTPSEYHDFYAGYIGLVPSGDLISLMETQVDATLRAFDVFTETNAARGYASGKWSIKEVAGHVIDTERIFCYRALCICRGETGSLPGFDQEAYVRSAGFNDRPLSDLCAELGAVRASTMALFRSLSDDAMTRTGRANEATLSVRAAACIVAGHERHHVNVLRERYLPLLA